MKREYRYLRCGNTVNDMRYEIKFEICVKVKNNFFIKRNIAFLWFTKLVQVHG